MNDVLNPLATSFTAKQANLPSHESAFYTACALVVKGPLGLAPVLVAAERRRRNLGAGSVDQAIGRALVNVPDVVAKPVDEARQILKDQGLTPLVEYHRSDAAEKDKVLRQLPPGGTDELVEEGSQIKLSVGAGPEDQPKDKIDLLLEQVTTVQQEISSLNSKVGAVERGLGEIKKDVDALQSDMGTVKNDVDTLKGKLPSEERKRGQQTTS
ncbi:PASTA domain-containing protein [Inquilinus limosus]|uniref:PASTA domain-containing protein n=1 Tax=Inquilinus limosus TaxID=171674 RepID=UPI003F17AE17